MQSRRQQERMKERRQTLIDALLTGDKEKIKFAAWDNAHPIGSPPFMAWLKTDEAIKIMEKLDQEY
jgi:DNA-directed RNA polymerase subunit L